MAPAEIGPQMRKLPEHRAQHLVARRQRVGDGRFPAGRSRTGKNEDLAPAGLEHFLEIGKQGQGEFGKIGSPLVLELDGHGLAHPFGDVGRARNKQSGISGFHVPQSLSKSSG